jgi:hypothetical protein
MRPLIDRSESKMRLWHLVLGIFVTALALSIARDPIGRVALIVFVVGLGEVVSGTVALLALFQTVGAIGEADSLSTHAGAVLATSVVLAAATSIMAALFFAGGWLVNLAVA